MAKEDVWLKSREAMALVPCRTLDAWYKWRSRKGIIPAGNGSVLKADVLRAKNRPDGRRFNRFVKKDTAA